MKGLDKKIIIVVGVLAVFFCLEYWLLVNLSDADNDKILLSLASVLFVEFLLALIVFSHNLTATRSSLKIKHPLFKIEILLLAILIILDVYLFKTVGTNSGAIITLVIIQCLDVFLSLIMFALKCKQIQKVYD